MFDKWELRDRLYMLSQSEKVELVIEYIINSKNKELFYEIADKYLREVGL